MRLISQKQKIVVRIINDENHTATAQGSLTKHNTGFNCWAFELR